MAEESLQFRLRKIDEARKYIFEEIKHDLISSKYKKTSKYLKCVDDLLFLVLIVTNYVSVSVVASFL